MLTWTVHACIELLKSFQVGISKAMKCYFCMNWINNLSTACGIALRGHNSAFSCTQPASTEVSETLPIQWLNDQPPPPKGLIQIPLRLLERFSLHSIRMSWVLWLQFRLMWELKDDSCHNPGTLWPKALTQMLEMPLPSHCSWHWHLVVV